MSEQFRDFIADVVLLGTGCNEADGNLTLSLGVLEDVGKHGEKISDRRDRRAGDLLWIFLPLACRDKITEDFAGLHTFSYITIVRYS